MTNSLKGTSTWDIYTTLDYASSEYGIEDLSSNYADVIASIRETNFKVDEIESVDLSGCVINDYQEKVEPLHTVNSELITSPHTNCVVSKKMTDDLNQQELKKSVNSLQSITNPQNNYAYLLTHLRSRLDITTDTIRLKSNNSEIISTKSTYCKITESSVDESSFYVEHDKAEFDCLLDEFAELHKFAESFINEQEKVTHFQNINSSKLEQISCNQVTHSKNQFKQVEIVKAQTAVVEPQYARENSKEVFTAARDLLKRLYQS